MDILGTLVVKGYVRGRPLDVNRLVYLPSLGAFQLAQIDVADAAHDLKAKDAMNTEGAAAGVTSMPDPEKQESLQTEVRDP